MKFHLGPRRLIATIIAAGFVASLAATPVASVAAASGSTQTLQNLTRIGTSHFVSAPTGLSGDTRTQALPTDTGDDLDTHAGRGPSGPPTKNPNPGPNRITSFNPGFSGFQGLDHFDTRTRDGGNAYSLEPPDQGLCVGNGYVLETINDVMVAFDSAGHRLTTPTSMNTFFNLPYAINRTTGVAGDFLERPEVSLRCGYESLLPVYSPARPCSIRPVPHLYRRLELRRPDRIVDSLFDRYHRRRRERNAQPPRMSLFRRPAFAGSRREWTVHQQQRVRHGL